MEKESHLLIQNFIVKNKKISFVKFRPRPFFLKKRRKRNE